jgi:hypothetical protein
MATKRRKRIARATPDAHAAAHAANTAHAGAHAAVELPKQPRNSGELTPEVERRILRFINGVRELGDFLTSAQRRRDTGGEHGAMEPMQPHDDHDHPKDPWRRIRLDKRLAREIIRRRPPLGYVDIAQVFKLDLRRVRAWLDAVLEWFTASSYGSWSPPIPIAVGGTTYAIQNAALLRTCKVLLIPSSTNTLLWDPCATATPLVVRSGAITGLTADLFCSGHSFLSDGKLLVAGGGGGSPGQPSSAEVWKFDPIAETWAKTPTNMAYRRWYPTVVTLGDEPGRALIISGWTDSSPATAPQMEIYSETTDSFTLVTTSGAVGEKVGPQTYPGMHLLPGGELFYAPVGFGNCSQTAAPHAATEQSGYYVFSGPASGSWTNTGANIRTKGMSVLLLQPTYPFVRVLVVGGGDAAQSASAQLINLSTLSPSWGDAFPLLSARVHPNVVLLPDGTAFICGGMEETGTPATGGPCELYDPAAGTLTEMADVAYPRHYHSVALLLPSGQVMVAGGARSGGCSLSFYNTIEVFSPPYLYNGARPTMSPLPSLVHHGHYFDIATPEADDIARVVLMRPMAVTHQTDSEQRVIALPFMQTNSTTLRATMPDGVHPHGIAPRGHYLLFILNAAGVPSEGQFIFLH